MSSTVIENHIIEYEPFEEDGSMLMVAESSISVIREDTLGQSFIRNFMMKYSQK